MWASHWEATDVGLLGTVSNDAHELFQQGVQAAVRDNFRELGAQWTMEDAESHAIAGQCAEARREISAGLELSSRQLHARAGEPHARAVRRRQRRVAPVGRTGESVSERDADDADSAARDGRGARAAAR